MFNDFKKLRHRCKDFKKIIATLTLALKNVKHEYEVALESRNELQKGYDIAKFENEALILELESKDKVLSECMNENASLKLSIYEKSKH